MIDIYRIRPALVASLKPLVASVTVALICAALVFGLWYPYPYGELVGGRDLFMLMVSVDVICGPLLTLVVFSPRKPRPELFRDIAIIVCLQVGALAYGMHSTIAARPVFLAFEKDIFRVVVAPEIDLPNLAQAREHLRDLSLLGPRLIAVKLAQPTDPEYLASVKAAIGGLHPAFRPERWLDYDQQRQEAISKARPISQLRAKHPDQQVLIDDLLKKINLTERESGFLPLTAKSRTDWVAVVSLADGEPKAFLPLDGWE